MGFFLPVSIIGVVLGAGDVLEGATDLLSSNHSLSAEMSLTFGVWMLLGGLGGLIGFTGLVACAVLPRRLLSGNRWARRVVAIALSCGVVGALAVALIPLSWGYPRLEPMQVVLLSLAFLGCVLVRDVTANPSIERAD